MDRLKSGHFIAVARNAQTGERRDRFCPIPPHFWTQRNPYGDDHFWITGDETFEIRDDPYRFLDIRFPPDWYEGSSTGQGFTGAQSAAGSDNTDERKPPAPAELKRFCRAVLSEWPDATEDWIRGKAELFFPDNRIRRDPFREILREIRGPVKRGKKPNN